MEIAFVLAPSQNRFFFEIVDALVYELRGLGVDASISTQGFPKPRRGLVYVLFPPHEYFVLEGHEQKVDEKLLKRSIFISAEQPESIHFEQNIQLAGFAGAIFDVNAAGVRAYRRRGVDAQLLQLGYSRALDHFQPDSVREIDLLFMGCVTERRNRILSACSRAMAPWSTKLVVSDNSRPNTRTTTNFFSGEDKFRLLQSASVLLNIHQSDEPYFEWARVLDAIHSGCVVLTEHSTDFGPLVPGEHFISARPEAIPYLLDSMLRDRCGLDRIRGAAYDVIQKQLRLSQSAEALADAASILDGTAPLPDSDPPGGRRSVDRVTRIDFTHEALRLRPEPVETVTPHPLFSSTNPELSLVRRTLKELRLELMEMKRSALRNQLSGLGPPVPAVEEVLTTVAYAARTNPRVSVVMALYNHHADVEGALNSLLRSRFTDWEVVVVNDGSTDTSLDVVRRWAHGHQHIALKLLSHPVNRGLGAARNTALEHARGDYFFVLDSDNSVYPNGLGDLVRVLDSDHEAAFAYGILASVRDGRPYGLVSYFPWEPSRLRWGNYIDAMALFRLDQVLAMGGYTTDRRLYGWEDYDLYCRMAEADCRGALHAGVVASYKSSATSMLSVTNISHTSAFAALKEHAPTLMERVSLPD